MTPLRFTAPPARPLERRDVALDEPRRQQPCITTAGVRRMRAHLESGS